MKSQEVHVMVLTRQMVEMIMLNPILMAMKTVWSIQNLHHTATGKRQHISLTRTNKTDDNGPPLQSRLLTKSKPSPKTQKNFLKVKAKPTAHSNKDISADRVNTFAASNRDPIDII